MKARHAAGYYLFLAVFGAGATATNAAVALADRLGRPPDPPRLRRRLRGLMAWYVRTLQRLGGLDLRYPGWPADWEAQVRGCLVVGNHPTLLDAPVLLARSPHFVCLYKAALEKSLLWPVTARRAGYLSNEDGIDTVRAAADRLGAGATLLLFPEGTRTRQSGLGAFEAGGALIAARAGCPVQTLVYSISRPLLTKEVPLRRLPELPVRMEVRWGERFAVAPGESVRAFNRRLEAYFRENAPPLPT